MSALASELGSTIGDARLLCIDEEPGQFAFFVWHNVIFIVWPTAATGRAVERLGLRVRDLLKEHPKGESHIHMVKAGIGLPTADARAGFVGLMHEFENNLAAVAVCLLGSGFWASAIQGAVTGMRMLAPRSFEMHIHNDMDSVALWLPDEHRKRTGVSVRPEDLLAAMREAFAAGIKSPSRGSQRAAVAAR
jgi:hypothetical protein